MTPFESPLDYSPFFLSLDLTVTVILKTPRELRAVVETLARSEKRTLVQRFVKTNSNFVRKAQDIFNLILTVRPKLKKKRTIRQNLIR